MTVVDENPGKVLNTSEIYGKSFPVEIFGEHYGAWVWLKKSDFNEEIEKEIVSLLKRAISYKADLDGKKINSEDWKKVIHEISNIEAHGFYGINSDEPIITIGVKSGA